MKLHSPTLQVNDSSIDLWRGTIDLGDGETLNIAITYEGIIMDHYTGEEVTGMAGMTFDEWADWMKI
ncbi:MAG: hypothetical protein VW799_08540 [Halieaceae bacterium]